MSPIVEQTYIFKWFVLIQMICVSSDSVQDIISLTHN